MLMLMLMVTLMVLVSPTCLAQTQLLMRVAQLSQKQWGLQQQVQEGNQQTEPQEMQMA